MLELVGEDPSIDPCYRYVMRVVESNTKSVPVGHTFTVETAWFVHRTDFRRIQNEGTP